ncbi:MAG: GNAT family N-acetyltransferase [Rhodospirillales bacterium]|jgi:GNAT superfamily N-acetyltransferase
MTLCYQSYVPGAVGRLLAMQIETYSRALGFGRPFEAKVGADMAAFLGRYDPGRDLFLTAFDDDTLVGGITLDRGEHDPALAVAHLRWFVVDESRRGQGIGGTLLDRAVAFARMRGDRHIYLWTVDALPAARRLYDAAGFVVAEQFRATTWGKEMLEQKLVLDLT